MRVGLPALDLVATDTRLALTTPVPAAQDRLPFTRYMHLDRVGFRYSDADSDVLTDVTLEIPFGSSVAVVGPSGSGKSTLIDLILGMHEPSRGTITVDGIDLAGHVPGWRQNIGLVPQSVPMINASVTANVTFDLAAEVDDHLLECARAAALTDVVAALPQGWDTVVGEHGNRLSGGQRQRVGIARALYRRPRLLVLDEATSALDNDTEDRVSQTVAALRGRATVIVVAHRLSTIQRCDQIVYLDGGRVLDQGTFAQLRESNADFDRLVRLGELS